MRLNGGAPGVLQALQATSLLLVYVWLAGAGTALFARAAPFPAHLVVHAGHRPQWQEYPVALNPLNGSSANFRPILPGTDHGLYNEGFFEGDILRKEAASKEDPDTKNAVSDPNLLWPSATVVYKVDDDVGCPESPQCAILMAAIDHYHENSCIRFKQWTGEDNWVSIFFNSDSSGACWSPVGRQGDGEQRLSLGQRCWYKGIVIHELGHAIGFWHEMNRPDRDDWIYVYWQNIIPGFASAFRKHVGVNTLGEHFDYRSIMMYDEYAFSKDGRSPTLQATTGEEIGPIWRKRGLSASDKRRLRKLYQCDPKKPKAGFPYDVNCDFNRHVCGFKNGGSANWSWRTVNQTDGYVYTSFDTAGTTPGHFMSINFPPTSSALSSVRGELGCVRFYYLIETDGGAQLVLEQAYLKKSTQLNHDATTTFQLWSNNTSTNEWIHMEIPLYVTRSFKLIFTSTFNASATHGTIALDDVELLYTPCNPVATDATTPEPAMAAPKPKPTNRPAATTNTSTTTTTTTEAVPTTPIPTTPVPSTPVPTTPVPSTPMPTTPVPTTTEAEATTTTDADAAVTTVAPVTSAEASSSTDASSTTSSGTTPAPATSTTPPAKLTTAEVEQAQQQLQLQQQQSILAAQQLLEEQQQKEQKQQLAAMAHSLQQHVAQHTAQHAHRQKIPNLPIPTDRIPLKNPNSVTDQSKDTSR
ncbi:Meprin A subunit beta [Frankliniella fusca]|uniref:Metalloendopeptidase n=1 Tax=Frankliniella fusca TaxID=407009 RepID=A0AAE1HZB8_9NEOP|nr:Meprin A subunit beta [Frankliniella fusca]